MTSPAKNLVLAAAALAVGACSSGIPEDDFIPVNLSGTVSIAAGPMPAGKLHFRIYVLESLEGELRHPLEEVEDFQSDAPEFTHSFDYPRHMGDGLAVHAWLDTDGDGIFCTPTARLDPSGIGYTEETPQGGDFTLDVTLTANCRSAHWFYPPAE